MYALKDAVHPLLFHCPWMVSQVNLKLETLVLWSMRIRGYLSIILHPKTQHGPLNFTLLMPEG